LAFELRYSATAAKQMRKLNNVVRLRIADYLDDVALLDDPTTRGKNLSGSYKSIWRYRVGDYRVLCDIRKNELIILALEISHRSKSYRNL